MSKSFVTSKEAIFHHHELFFSTTNKRGVIESGNSVFVRVSGYPLEKLIHSPHSIIRHPDMPRCVFKLFWNTLQTNQPIGAYVKNRAQDGSYYWVYAVAFPIDDGYMSLRLKPSSPVFSKVSELYRLVLEFENEHGMDAALAFLVEKIRGLGFANYESFMIHALNEELRSRDQLVPSLREKKPFANTPFHQNALTMVEKCQIDYRTTFESLFQLLESGKALRACADSILARFSDLNFLSVNMAIGAAKVGVEGRVLAEVSQGFQRVAEQIQTQVQQFNAKLSKVTLGIAGTQFHIGCSRLQIEMLQFFLEEAIRASASEDEAFATESFLKNYQCLLNLARTSTDQVILSLEDLSKPLKELLKSAEELLAILNGLEVIRLIGKVEAARLSENHRQSFDNHIHEMTEFVARLSEQLKMVRGHGNDCFKQLKSCLTRLPETKSYVLLMSESGKEEAARL